MFYRLRSIRADGRISYVFVLVVDIVRESYFAIAEMNEQMNKWTNKYMCVPLASFNACCGLNEKWTSRCSVDCVRCVWTVALTTYVFLFLAVLMFSFLLAPVGRKQRSDEIRVSQSPGRSNERMHEWMVEGSNESNRMCWLRYAVLTAALSTYCLSQSLWCSSFFLLLLLLITMMLMMAFFIMSDSWMFFLCRAIIHVNRY